LRSKSDSALINRGLRKVLCDNICLLLGRRFTARHREHS
jgi:hypothetical protein